MEIREWTDVDYQREGKAYCCVSVEDLPINIYEREFTMREAKINAKDRLLELIKEATDLVEEINKDLEDTDK